MNQPLKTPSIPRDGRAVDLVGYVKGTTLIGFWEATDGISSRGGSLVANKDSMGQ